MSKNNFSHAVTTYLAQYLPGQRGVSPNTIRSYRDTLVLLLRYARDAAGISPEQMDWSTVNPELVEGFLHWLEQDRCVFRSQLTGNPESREHLVRKVVNTQSGKSLTPGPENREHPVRKIVNSETEIFRMLFLLYSLRRSLARAGSGIFPPRVAAWPSLAA